MEGAHISVISVPVSNPDVAKDFYIGVLGFEVEMDQVSPAMRWVMLRLPGTQTAVTLTTWFETMLPGSLRGTVLSVTDIEGALAELRAKGAVEDDAEIESAPWGRWVTVEDPDGNGWIIQQDTEGPIELEVAD
jgi:catechol 2,3-dioxygenase-like lactoylglutathione lyase family enzyme